MQGGGAGGGGGVGAGAGAGGAGAGGAPKNLPLNYICGHCNSLNRLSPRDIVRCKECGYRIFYKVRPDRRACPLLAPLPGGLRAAACARVGSGAFRAALACAVQWPGQRIPASARLFALASAREPRRAAPDAAPSRAQPSPSLPPLLVSPHSLPPLCAQ